MKSKCRQNPISLAVSDPWSQSAGDFKVALILKEGLGGDRSEKIKGVKKERKKLRARVIFKWDSV